MFDSIVDAKVTGTVSIIGLNEGEYIICIIWVVKNSLSDATDVYVADDLHEL